MNEEMASLMKNKTWKLIEKPVKMKTVSCKWIFKIKDGILELSLEDLRLNWWQGASYKRRELTSLNYFPL